MRARASRLRGRWLAPLPAAALALLVWTGCRSAARSPERAQDNRDIPAMPAAQEGVKGGANAWFVDVTRSAGLAYRWTLAEPRPLNILQTIGNGCAFLDYDQDEHLDILLVGSPPALFRNKGVPVFRRSGVQALGRPDPEHLNIRTPEHPLFEDVTAATGLDRLSGHFLGCAVGDYDNDGFPDLYLSGYRTGLLLRNEAENGVPVFRRSGVQDSRPEHLNTQTPEHLNTRTPERRVFRDVTGESGLAPQPWGTSAAFVDVDGDGWLDLYVCNYVRFGPTTEPQLCPYNGILSACGPRFYNPLKGVLYRNVGAQAFKRSGVQDSRPEHPNTRTPGRRVFRDVTQEWGAHRVSGKGLGIVAADYDSSGRQSLAIANDEMPGDLLRNVGGRFENVAESAGTAFDSQGREYGGMGIDWGDYDNDGRFDLFVATFQHESKNLYRNEGDGRFTESSAPLGLAEKTRPYVAFGAKFLDFDNDGFLDLMIANGHVQDNVAEIETGRTFKQPTQLFRNRNGTAFEEVTAQGGPSLQNRIMGRGLAVGDYDNDGRVDALVVDSDGAPLLLHNETPDVGHWLLCKLQGAKSSSHGIGAIVTVEAAGRKITRRCATDGSYLSASDRRVHFGLGASRVATVTVRWPSGTRSVYRGVRADRIVTLLEGAKEVR